MRAIASVLLTTLVLAITPASPAGIGRDAAHTEGEQRLLVLAHPVVARARPAAAAPVLATISNRTPLTGSQMELPVVGASRGPKGGRWLRVRLPMRPNGVTGWVPADSGMLGETPWRIVVHRSRLRAVVLSGHAVRATFAVVLGTAATPTPLGTFFVVEKVQVAPGVPEGPWALATSAYSDVLHEFAGGPGQIALHGIVGLNDPLGTFSSHGCIRFSTAAITWLAGHVGAGTPVVIEP
jgi:lipoprotein-anchoring transpeptidase ErfK/SrfK